MHDPFPPNALKRWADRLGRDLVSTTARSAVPWDMTGIKRVRSGSSASSQPTAPGCYGKGGEKRLSQVSQCIRGPLCYSNAAFTSLTQELGKTLSKVLMFEVDIEG